MKHWQETSQVLERMNALLAAGKGAVLATIISIEGSTYRRPGAKLLLTAEGKDLGNVSGGCLEEDVAEAAADVLEKGVGRTLFYDTSDEGDLVFGMGLGCNGKIELHLEPFHPGDEGALLLPALRGALDGDRAFSASRLVSSERAGFILQFEDGGPEVLVPADNGELEQRLLKEARGALDDRRSRLVPAGQDERIFTEFYEPPPALVVCGAGDDAVPLVRLAAETGFRIWLFDHRSAYLRQERFSDAFRLLKVDPEDGLPGELKGKPMAAVIKTHAYQRDLDWAKVLLGSSCGYIGILGPSSRRKAILDALGEDGDDRIFSPVGLDIGGEGPEQVALSIMAECMAVYHDRRGGFLRDRQGPIHDPS